MKRVVVLSLVLLMGGLAYADRVLDTSAYTLTATPIGEAALSRSPVGWSNMDLSGNLSSMNAVGTCVAYEDYACDPSVWGSGTTFTLEKFRFYGGVANVDETIWFNFYDANTTPDCGISAYDYFGVTLPDAGNWIWTITINGGMTVNTEGYVELDGTDYGWGPADATWYLDDSGPTVGTSAPAPYDPYTCAFELEGVPEPAGLLLLGVAGVLLRRR